MLFAPSTFYIKDIYWNQETDSLLKEATSNMKETSAHPSPLNKTAKTMFRFLLENADNLSIKVNIKPSRPLFLTNDSQSLVLASKPKINFLAGGGASNFQSVKSKKNS